MGKHEVTIRVKRTWPYEFVSSKYGNVWDKIGAKYQADHEQTFTITVTE